MFKTLCKQKEKLFPQNSKHAIWKLEGNTTFWDDLWDSLCSAFLSYASGKKLFSFYFEILQAPFSQVYLFLYFSENITHEESHHDRKCDALGLVLRSIAAALLSVCVWLGVMSLNTHICCSSMVQTMARSAIKMTLTVKCNKIRRCFRSFLTLGLNGQRCILNNYHVAMKPERVT